MKKSSRILPHVMKRVLPVVVIGLLALWGAVRTIAADVLRRQVHQRVEMEADQGAGALDAGLHHLVDHLRNLASNNLIVNSLIDFTDRNDYLSLFFMSLRILGAEEEQIVLTDYRGRILASNRQNMPDYSGAAWIEAVMKGREHIAITAKGLLAAVPVLYDGWPEGALVFKYAAGRVSEMIPLPALYVAFAVFDAQGGLIGASPGAPWKRVPSASNLNAEEGKWMQASRSIDAFGLTLVCGEPVSKAFQPLRRLDLFFFGAIFLNLLATAGAVYMSARMVANPLSSFVNSLYRITGLTDLEGRVSESGPAEFQKLGRSFNRLLGNLKDSAAKLQESEATARAILNASPAAIVLLDREGFVLDCNDVYPARFGISRESLVGSRIWDLFPEDVAAKRKARVQAVFDTTEPFSGKDERDGVWNEYRIEPAVRASDGRVQSVVVETMDITEQEKFREIVLRAETLQAMEAGRAQMAAMVLHQVGNALTPVGVLTEQLLADAQNRSLEYLEKAYQDLREHREDLKAYVNENERGRRVFDFMKEMIEGLKQRDFGRREMDGRIARAVSKISEMLIVQREFADSGWRTALVEGKEKEMGG